jgi:hypothetical protein
VLVPPLVLVLVLVLVPPLVLVLVLPLVAVSDREAGSRGGLGVQVSLAEKCTARHQSWPPRE